MNRALPALIALIALIACTSAAAPPPAAPAPVAQIAPPPVEPAPVAQAVAPPVAPPAAPEVAVAPPAAALAPVADVPVAAAAQPAGAPLNAEILSLVNHYRPGPANPYEWVKGMNTDGVSRDLFWQGVPLAGRDGGIHCSGITFEVYVQALQASLGDPARLSADELLAVKEDWYIRTGKDGGPADALGSRGLGERVSGLADLQPGDFIQFWRNNGKGHSAIFIEHTHNRDGSIRGLVYWSAQGSSGGIGRRIASMGDDINQISRLYGVRAIVPAAG